MKAIQEKMAGNDDPHFQARATVIKEQRAELAKHHVSVLWSDYFKPPHFEKYPELHQLVNDTLKALSAAKASTDPATGQKALDHIARSTRSSGRPRRPDTGFPRRTRHAAPEHGGPRVPGACFPVLVSPPSTLLAQPAVPVRESYRPPCR